jgi:hypothetical protein
MSGELDALTGHFERMRGRTYTVPGVELADGKPFVVHYDPVTNAQASAIRARAKGDDALLSLYTVVMLAKRPDGSRMFEDNAATIAKLREAVSGAVIAGIAAAIMGDEDSADLGN